MTHFNYSIGQRPRRDFQKCIRRFISDQEVWILEGLPEKRHSITRHPIVKQIIPRSKRAKTMGRAISDPARVIREHRNKWRRNIYNICQCIHRVRGNDRGIGIFHQLHKVRYDWSRLRPNQLKSKTLCIIGPHLSGADENSRRCGGSFYVQPICNFYEPGSPPRSITLNPFHEPRQSIRTNLSNGKFSLFFSLSPILTSRSRVLINLQPLTQLLPLVLRLSFPRPKRNHTNPNQSTHRQNDDHPFPPHNLTLSNAARFRNLFAPIFQLVISK